MKDRYSLEWRAKAEKMEPMRKWNSLAEAVRLVNGAGIPSAFALEGAHTDRNGHGVIISDSGGFVGCAFGRSGLRSRFWDSNFPSWGEFAVWTSRQDFGPGPSPVVTAFD